MTLMCFPAPPYRCSTNALLHACAAPYALTLHEATPVSRAKPYGNALNKKLRRDPRARATADERSSSERSVLLRATMELSSGPLELPADKLRALLQDIGFVTEALRGRAGKPATAVLWGSMACFFLRGTPVRLVV